MLVCNLILKHLYVIYFLSVCTEKSKLKKKIKKKSKRTNIEFYEK